MKVLPHDVASKVVLPIPGLGLVAALFGLAAVVVAGTMFWLDTVGRSLMSFEIVNVGKVSRTVLAREVAMKLLLTTPSLLGRPFIYFRLVVIA